MALCYKDRTFCASDCMVSDCWRYFGPEQSEGARRWWSHDPDNAPIAWHEPSVEHNVYEAEDET